MPKRTPEPDVDLRLKLSDVRRLYRSVSETIQTRYDGRTLARAAKTQATQLRRLRARLLESIEGAKKK